MGHPPKHLSSPLESTAQVCLFPKSMSSMCVPRNGRLRARNGRLSPMVERTGVARLLESSRPSWPSSLYPAVAGFQIRDHRCSLHPVSASRCKHPPPPPAIISILRAQSRHCAPSTPGPLTRQGAVQCSSRLPRVLLSSSHSPSRPRHPPSAPRPSSTLPSSQAVALIAPDPHATV
jgi:hypothetical protein